MPLTRYFPYTAHSNPALAASYHSFRSQQVYLCWWGCSSSWASSLGEMHTCKEQIWIWFWYECKYGAGETVKTNTGESGGSSQPGPPSTWAPVSFVDCYFEEGYLPLNSHPLRPTYFWKNQAWSIVLSLTPHVWLAIMLLVQWAHSTHDQIHVFVNWLSKWKQSLHTCAPLIVKIRSPGIVWRQALKGYICSNCTHAEYCVATHVSCKQHSHLRYMMISSAAEQTLWIDGFNVSCLAAICCSPFLVIYGHFIHPCCSCSQVPAISCPELLAEVCILM